MGLTSVPLTISNLKIPSKKVSDTFLVDSGASLTVLPEALWKKLDVKPEKKIHVNLTDGSIVSRNVGYAFVEFEGNKVPTEVVLGEKDDSKLLGVLTLEQMNLTLDPFKRKLTSMHLRI